MVTGSRTLHSLLKTAGLSTRWGEYIKKLGGYDYGSGVFLQRAVKKGAVGVKDPWEESDEDGTVTYAVVQTVSTYFPPLDTLGGVK